MERRKLGSSDLDVSVLCLGSMTWGSQNTEAEGHAQIDHALGAGINFIDTAEMYPTTPVRPETTGRTEEIIGTWVASSGRRNDVLIATKIIGPNGGMIRDGRGIDAGTLPDAIDGSLRRLQTDHIDLYQLHWPNRGSYHFRQNWTFDPSEQNTAAVHDNMVEVLDTLSKAQAAGKIREIGLSNESAWGTSEWLRLAAQTGGPRMISMQNEYSLLCRTYDTDLAELSHHERIGLVAFSPLAAGLLTGKYRGGALPEGSRGALNPEMGGRRTERADIAVGAYADIAARHGLSLPQMALAWSLTRPFMASAIFGATTMAQLDKALGAVDVTLSDDVMSEIDLAHRAHPMPY